MNVEDLKRDAEHLPDWVHAQRRWLQATEVGRLGIHPPWCSPVGQIPVSIDPGPTFGHGAHPTTALVLGILDEMAICGLSVLDIGCGSGVLAIAAARLGAGSVTGVDIEEAAVEWTMRNAVSNGVEINASTTPVAALDGLWDLTLANVLPTVHSAIAADVTRLVGGALVISGIPDEHTNRIVHTYTNRGLVESRRSSDRGWTVVLMQRATAELGFED